MIELELLFLATVVGVQAWTARELYKQTKAVALLNYRVENLERERFKK